MLINSRQSTESRQAEIIATMVRLSAEGGPAYITTKDIAKAMTVTQRFDQIYVIQAGYARTRSLPDLKTSNALPV
jgi:hypothetical protein